ncbi:uncharacterized protein LOC111119226 isoform X1 [Crassostrea virginica]
MRITTQFLRSKCKGPLPAAEYLDLSNSEIVVIEKLSNCPKLQTLILRGNRIYEVSNFECCPQLWNVDLSNNEIKSLDGLSRFVAIGTLNLSNNDLTWHELGKIRHIHILNLSLHGNSQMEKDPYYRIHLIDCLPNVWMLDGRIVTSAERLQVKHFFQDSALTSKPIRHKLSKEWFIPTARKKIEVNGIYGAKATKVMTTFPANGVHNIETDKKRLKYLGYNIQEDLVIDKKFTNREFQVMKYRRAFIEDLLEARPEDRERCNMLLLFLVASLEFVLPTHLVKETLDTAKLNKIGQVFSMDLFLLPRDVRCLLVCILLGAVKIDKDDKEDGGLYDKLYLCLFYTVSELVKLSHASNAKHSAVKSKLNTLYYDYKSLLASEVVQLLCIVPAFFQYVAKDVGVMNLVVTATGDHDIKEKITAVSTTVSQEGGEVRRLYEELSELLLQKVQEQSLNISNKTPKMSKCDQILTSRKAFPMRNSGSVEMAEFHAKGVTSPEKDPPRVLSAKRSAERNRKKFPHLGDPLLLGPQTLGKIVSLPQPFVALVAMDSVPVANGAMESKLKASEDHYTYVNMEQLMWDEALSFWKPRGAIGDSILLEFIATFKYKNRLTLHTVEDLQRELELKASVADKTQRPNTPDWMTSNDPNTPLIYSPRVPPVTPPETPKTKKKQVRIKQNVSQSSLNTTPRPMSSVLKDKLDLKLEMSRRAMSAGRVLERTQVQIPAHTQPPATPTSVENEVKEVRTETDPPHTESATDPENSDSCLHCALEAAMSGDKLHQDNVQASSGEEVEGETKEHNQSRNGEGQPANKETEESELKSEEAVGHPHPKDPVTPPEGAGKQQVTEETLAVTGLTLKMQDSGEGPETARTNGETTSRSEVKGSGGHGLSTSRQSTPRTGQRPASGKKQVSTRPYSAMDAYRYIVSHPIRTSTEAGYNTSYQRQRTEAWKQTTAKPANMEDVIKVSVVPVVTKSEGRRKSPPPQRPSSPAAIIQIQSSSQQQTNASRPSSALHVKVGSDWLAGGRDLFWENIQKRPRSGHVPGWKEGLPESMKRPRSAVANRTLRRSRASTPITPSSLLYESMLHGYPTPNGSLPELTDLSDYPHLSGSHRIRMLGTPQGGQAEFYTTPPHDTVYSYRNPPCTPMSHSAKLNVISMQCIPEVWTEDNVANYINRLEVFH